MTEEQSIQEKFAKFLSSYKTGKLEKKSKWLLDHFDFFVRLRVFLFIVYCFQLTKKELSAGFDELDVDEFDPEEVLKMMDPEERRAFEQAVKENTLVQTIRANIEPWVSPFSGASDKSSHTNFQWHKSCAILTDDLPTLKSVPRMNPKLLERVNPIIFLSICELVATYCYIMERYIFDPDDMISEVVDDFLHIR